MREAYDWLGRWEPIEAPGRHCKRIPAPFAHGYRYDPHVYRQHGVSRAIPVDGRIGASWEGSPQARFWLEPERKSLKQRIIEWLRRPC